MKGKIYTFVHQNNLKKSIKDHFRLMGPPVGGLSQTIGSSFLVTMRNKFSLLLAAAGLLLGSANVEARSWRINSNPDAKPNFESINAAMESLDVFAGDTLYLDPGCQLRGQTISKKRITVIGTGYNLEEGTGESSLLGTTSVTADSVKVEGCHLTTIELKANNVTFERCKVTSNLTQGSGSRDQSNLKLLSCLFVSTNGTEINGYYSQKGCLIENCILVNTRIHTLNAATITNNVIVYKGVSRVGLGTVSNVCSFPLSGITNSTITNNIILNTNTEYNVGDDQVPFYYKNQTIYNVETTDNNTITHNVLSTEAAHAFANHPNNKFIGAVPEDIFVLEGTEDARYQVKEGSAADGYGTNGYECGAFSGQYPYVLSGRPRFIPYIYEAVIPNQPTDGKLNVTLKIKTQNE